MLNMMAARNRTITYLVRCLALSLVMAFTNCTTKSVRTEAELAKYILEPANGLIKTIEAGDITLEVMYKPTDLIVAQEADGETLSAQQIDSLKQVFSQYDYFILRLSKSGKDLASAYAQNDAEFNKVSEYLTSLIGQDMTLICGKEVLSVEDFMYAPTFGSSKTSDLLVAFKHIDTDTDVTFQLNDQLFGTGISQFIFNSSELYATPKLKPL